MRDFLGYHVHIEKGWITVHIRMLPCYDFTTLQRHYTTPKFSVVSYIQAIIAGVTDYSWLFLDFLFLINYNKFSSLKI